MRHLMRALAALVLSTTFALAGPPATLVDGGGAEFGTAANPLKATVQTALPAGSNTIGTVNVQQSTAANLKVDLSGTATNTNALNVAPTAAVTSGGALSVRIRTDGAAIAGVVKAGAGRFYGGTIVNRSAGERVLKLYNKATTPVPASDTPVASFPLAAGQKFDVPQTLGVYFNTGIAWVIVQGVADTDATAAAADDVHGWLLYF